MSSLPLTVPSYSTACVLFSSCDSLLFCAPLVSVHMSPSDMCNCVRVTFCSCLGARAWAAVCGLAFLVNAGRGDCLDDPGAPTLGCLWLFRRPGGLLSTSCQLHLACDLTTSSQRYLAIVTPTTRAASSGQLPPQRSHRLRCPGHLSAVAAALVVPPLCAALRRPAVECRFRPCRTVSSPSPGDGPFLHSPPAAASPLR